MTAEEYIDERLNAIREWYDGKAAKAKKVYQWMRATTVVGGALVPVLINLDLPFLQGETPESPPTGSYVTTVVSLLVVVLISLESVFHFREQWKNYRSTEQFLAKEYFNFATGEGAYRDLEEREAFLNFVDRVENTIASENASTLNVMTTLSEKKAESGAQPPEASRS